MSVDHGLSVMSDSQIRRLLQKLFGLHVTHQDVADNRLDLEAKILMKMDQK